MRKKVIILGCTGSIGSTAMDLVRQMRDQFQLTGLSAHTNEQQLLSLASEFQVTATALSGTNSTRVKYSGNEGLLEMIRETDADLVLHGISGASGLQYSIESLTYGKDLALANKESVVMAGRLLIDLAAKHGRSIIPVDSEHSAIFQLLRYRPKEIIRSLILTASGGPFRTLPIEKFSQITLEDALNHPTWVMGKKITIDSATLANKGLEVIETSRLFSLPPEAISVVLHPQSIIHSMIETLEGSLYAQMSSPNMKLPILNALSYPEISGKVYQPFSLVGKTLTFEAPDTRRFPMLSYAFDAVTQGDSYTIVYNAANEAAVDAFMHRRISFTDIPRAAAEVLSLDWKQDVESFETVMEIDKQARAAAGNILDRLW